LDQNSKGFLINSDITDFLKGIFSNKINEKTLSDFLKFNQEDENKNIFLNFVK